MKGLDLVNIDVLYLLRAGTFLPGPLEEAKYHSQRSDR